MWRKKYPNKLKLIMNSRPITPKIRRSQQTAGCMESAIFFNSYRLPPSSLASQLHDDEIRKPHRKLRQPRKTKKKRNPSARKITARAFRINFSLHKHKQTPSNSAAGTWPIRSRWKSRSDELGKRALDRASRPYIRRCRDVRYTHLRELHTSLYYTHTNTRT